MKKKQCKVCGQEKYMFSKGRCKSCAQIDYARAYQEKQREEAKKKKKPFLSPTKKHKEAKDAERIAMAAFWKTQQDWKGDCHCAECGQNLGKEMNPYNVAHIISKGANSSFRCDLRNFILLCADHHNQFDAGSREAMNVYAMTEKIRISLKLEDSKNV